MRFDRKNTNQPPPFLPPLSSLQFLGGINLLTGPTDPHWKAVRKGVAPAFSAGCMKNAFNQIVERCAFMTTILDRVAAVGAPVNVDDLLLRESMDVIGRVGFQKEMGALAGLAARLDGGADDVGSYVRTMLECTHEIENRLKEPHRAKFLWKPSVRRGHALMNRWKAIVKDNLLQHIKDVVPVKGSFADLLLKVKDPRTGAALEDGKLLPEIAALFFAGTDTTGHTGTWALYLLSQHRDVEARVLAELQEVGVMASATNPTPRPLEYSDLAKLPYLQAVVKETLRLFPPVAAGQVRVADTDLTLAGGRLVVPRGTMLWVPHHALHNTTFNWGADVDDFKPDRWLAPGAEYAAKLPMPTEWYGGWYDADAHNKAIDAAAKATSASPAAEDAIDPDDIAAEKGRAKRYIPFAEGPRNCVGQSLAKVSLVATLASLLPKFKFELDESMGGAAGVRAREQYTLVTGIENGMWMKAVPRA